MHSFKFAGHHLCLMADRALFWPARRALLVADHIEHHLEDVVGPLSREAREKLARLTDLAKYL